MSYVVKSKSEGQQFELPEPGLHRAVCVDVYDAGVVDTPWGPKEKVMLVWELDEDHPDFAGPFRVNKKYTPSLSDKATLRKDLQSWRGKPFTEQELEGFDLEKLIGVPCLVNVVHNPGKDGRIWANVDNVQKHDSRLGEPLKPSEHYVRMKDQQKKENANGQAKTQEVPGEDFDFEADADLPF